MDHFDKEKKESKILPSEDWPPYKFLWEHIGGRPWTHIMREHPKLYFSILIPLVFIIIAWHGKKHWKTLIGFALGFLTGHVWW